MRRNAHDDDFGRGIFRPWKRIGCAIARRSWFVRERDERARRHEKWSSLFDVCAMGA